MKAPRMASSVIQGLATGVAEAAPRKPAAPAASRTKSVIALLMKNSRGGACNGPTPAHIRALWLGRDAGAPLLRKPGAWTMDLGAGCSYKHARKAGNRRPENIWTRGK